MQRIKQIRQNYKNGRMPFVDLEWLMDTVEEQQKVIANMKEKSRFFNYMKMAEENLILVKRVEELEVVEKAYRAYMSAK